MFSSYFEKYKGCLKVTLEFCWRILMSEVAWLIILLKRCVQIGKKKFPIKQCLSWHEKKFRYHLTIEKNWGISLLLIPNRKKIPQYNHIIWSVFYSSSTLCLSSQNTFWIVRIIVFVLRVNLASTMIFLDTPTTI